MHKRVNYKVELSTLFDLDNTAPHNRATLELLSEDELVRICVGALTSVLDDVNKGNTWAKVELVGVSN